MRQLVTSEEMRTIDLFTINEIGISGFTLMENAGRECAKVIINQEAIDTPITIFCGTGNNGGDGFVIARYLFTGDYDVNVVIIGEPDQLKGDAKLHYECLLKSDFDKFVFNSSGKINEFASVAVDALLGTGVKGDIREPYLTLINRINKHASKIYSIDIPTGLCSDTGRTLGEYVRDAHVLTIGEYKEGLFLNEANSSIKLKTCLDIGFPKIAFEKIKCNTFLVEQSDIKMPIRSIDSHKGNFGKLVLCSGSEGMIGAAALSSDAVLRIGGGVSKVLINESDKLEASKLLKEVIIEYYSNNLLDKLNQLSSWATAFAIGMGLENNEVIKSILDNVIPLGKPIIIDASAINVFPIDKYTNLEHVLFTPHLMEFSRLTNASIESINKNPVKAVKNFSTKYNTYCLLKGKTTLISNPEGCVYFVTTGNSALSTPGSGDALTGIVLGLIGQGLSIKEAAITGSFLHGRAGELASDDLTEYCVNASDILNYLPEAIHEIKPV